MTESHGGNIYKYKDFLDFSANINPLGMPESVRKAIIDSAEMCVNYPDPFCRELVEKISESEKIPTEKIVCGNGADDLIYRIVSAFKPSRAVVCVPCFSEYGKALAENNCEIIEYFLTEENNFSLSEDFIEFLENIDMVFLGSPNNPTGRTVSPEILRKTAEKCRKNNIILVCDECFMDFVADGRKKSVINFLNENIIVLKAFTKIYAMAGLRLGYALFGSADKAEKVRNTGQYWSVSVPAQTAGAVALGEKKYLEKTVEFIAEERRFIAENFAEIGIKVYDSEANFIFFRCGKPVDELLKNEKILIRNCGNYRGLDGGFFRTAVRTHEENILLVSAVRRALNG